METEPVSPSQGGQNEPGMVRPWLLVVLVIAVLAGIGFFSWKYLQGKKTDNKIAINNSVIATPTPVTGIVVSTPIPTVSLSPISIADWKTYTNKDEGYTVKYPTMWQFIKAEGTDVTGSAGFGFSLTSPATLAAVKNNASVAEQDIQVRLVNIDGNENITFDQYQKANSQTVQKTGTTQINGVNSDVASIVGEGASFSIYIPKNNKLIEIGFHNRPDITVLNSEEQQILSTFQFTK